MWAVFLVLLAVGFPASSRGDDCSGSGLFCQGGSCDPGRICHAKPGPCNDVCRDCPDGKYKSGYGMDYDGCSDKRKCSVGQYAEYETLIDKTRDTECRACPGGQYQAVGAFA